MKVDTSDMRLDNLSFNETIDAITDLLEDLRRKYESKNFYTGDQIREVQDLVLHLKFIVEDK